MRKIALVLIFVLLVGQGLALAGASWYVICVKTKKRFRGSCLKCTDIYRVSSGRKATEGCLSIGMRAEKFASKKAAQKFVVKRCNCP